MKHLLLTTIAAVLLVGCGESQQPVPSPEAKPVEPVADAAKPEGQPEPTTAKAPNISIHRAVAIGNIEAVKQHLAAGVDVNAKDVLYRTPLHNAAFLGHKEIVELLIANGADVNARDDGGATPLDWAKEMNERHSPEAKVAKKEVATILLRKHGGKTGEELKAEGK